MHLTEVASQFRKMESTNNLHKCICNYDSLGLWAASLAHDLQGEEGKLKLGCRLLPLNGPSLVTTLDFQGTE
jgi:hypothetical protein